MIVDAQRSDFAILGLDVLRRVADHLAGLLDALGLVLDERLGALGQLEVGDGQHADAELLEDLAFVDHDGPEGLGAGADLKDLRFFKVTNRRADSRESFVAALEGRVVDIRVGDIGEGDVHAAKRFAAGEQTALRVAGTADADTELGTAVVLGGVIARAPKQHGNLQLTRHTGDRRFAAKVAVREEHAVDFRIVELFDDRFHVVFRLKDVQRGDVGDVNDLDDAVAGPALDGLENLVADFHVLRVVERNALRGRKTDLNDLLHFVVTLHKNVWLDMAFTYVVSIIR